MSDQIRETIITQLREMNYDVDGATRDTPLGPQGLDLESLGVAELMLRIEDCLGVKFGDGEMENLADLTIGDLASEISARAGASNAS